MARPTRRDAAPTTAPFATTTEPTVAAPATAAEPSFFEGGTFELSHSWEETEAQKLTPAELESIKEIRIAQGTYSKRMDFKMKSGKTRVINLSNYCPDYPLGTRIRPSSVVITQLYDEMEDRIIYRAYGEAL